MTRRSPEQQDAPNAAARHWRVPASSPRIFAAVLLCSLITAGMAPASTSPGDEVNAERTSASMSSAGDPAVPDPPPSRDPSLVDTRGAATGPGQAVVATSPAAPPAAVQAVVVSMLASDGIPVIALRAYQHAAVLANQRTAGCGISWALLAAIGRVESDHGQFAGSVLLANGLSTPRIIGIPLNGLGTGLVLDTDHGALDGDPVFDHAVGPMQFIPSTWTSYAADGNGDGIADPFNIFDAAAAASKYLCSAGTDLRTRAGKVRAVLAYNHSDSYVASVLALEATYAGAPIIAEPALFTPVASAPLPPVNPGVPPAIYPTALRPTSSPSPSKTSPAPTSLAVGPTPAPPPTDTYSAPTTTAPTPADTASAPIPTPTETAATPTTTPTPTDSAVPTPTPTPTDSSATPTPTAVPTSTPSCTTPAPAPTDAPTGALTDAQKTTLAALMEEQKLAHDLYDAFANAYATSVFGCVSSEVSTQLTATGNLLTLYAVADPTAGQPPGKFTSAAIQQQYESLLAQGTTSLDSASAAARSLESTSIADLTAAATDLSAPDVLQLYANLLEASQRHLAAFGG